MNAAPLVVLNGYPGVGKASVASALRTLIPESRYLQNHLLIEPVAALLDREENGYRDLRKQLRTPIMNCISNNPALRQRTIITTYYQETLHDREIDLIEYFEAAKRAGRPFIVVILRCSTEENLRRLSSRSASPKSRLADPDILKEIRKNHFVYSFLDAGYTQPDVWEFQLDIEDVGPEDAARDILGLMLKVSGDF